MAKNRGVPAETLSALLRAFNELPMKARVVLVALLVVLGVALWASGAFQTKPAAHEQPPPDTKTPAEPTPTPVEPDTSPLVNVPPTKAAFPAGTRSVVFCFWNVENLFDDHADHRR